MLAENFKKDLKLSFEIVWIVYSLIILTVLFISVFFPDALIKISPVCISKSLYGKECFMCGMTRAFVEISGGNLSQAYDLNSFSLVLYSAFVLNGLLFIYHCIRRIQSKRFFIKRTQDFNKFISLIK
jgi:Protein of unknown function (DUF2752)